jgi:hypothetical protein
MNRRVKAWQLPPRLITGAYFLNSGLSKRGADDATAGQLHGFATGTYPVLGKLDAKRFTGLLSTAEIAIGTALVLPMVPAWPAGGGLTAFALGTLGLYLRTPGMREEVRCVPPSRESHSPRTPGWSASGSPSWSTRSLDAQAGPDRLPRSLRMSP